MLGFFMANVFTFTVKVIVFRFIASKQKVFFPVSDLYLLKLTASVSLNIQHL